MAAGGAAGAAAAATANAIKASGVLVRVAPQEFLRILTSASSPLIVIAEGGFFSKKFKYLMSYKGLAFFTKSDEALTLPANAEIVRAGGISIPD